MNNSKGLSNAQKKVLLEFYGRPATKVAFNTIERKKIWDEFKKHRKIDSFNSLKVQVPAFFSEMNKALVNKKNIQPAVFSECVYAQAIADKFELTVFSNHKDTQGVEFSFENIDIKDVKNLTVRYSYTDLKNKITLIQAGGASGVDCALVSYEEKIATMLELKEPYARTSAPDLPKYGEDGILVTSDRFEKDYPQFKSMLEEQIKNRFNVFEHVGKNFSDFSSKSIEKAVTENYTGTKYADFICTEDSSGCLVIVPCGHVAKWAKLEGELRPTGRNSYPVWTPVKLTKVIKEKGGKVVGDSVTMPLSSFKQSKARGGERISRFKISPLFFIRSEDAETTQSQVSFTLDSVEQNIPDITTKINFKGIQFSKLKEFYTDKI
jgi:hypothetical protein